MYDEQNPYAACRLAGQNLIVSVSITHPREGLPFIIDYDHTSAFLSFRPQPANQGKELFAQGETISIGAPCAFSGPGFCVVCICSARARPRVCPSAQNDCRCCLLLFSGPHNSHTKRLCLIPASSGIQCIRVGHTRAPRWGLRLVTRNAFYTPGILSAPCAAQIPLQPQSTILQM